LRSRAPELLPELNEFFLTNLAVIGRGSFDAFAHKLAFDDFLNSGVGEVIATTSVSLGSLASSAP
jgi:hypothetical protein